MSATVDARRIDDPALRSRLTWIVVGLALLWPLCIASEFKPWQMLDAQSLRATRQFLGTFLPPAVSPEFLAITLHAAWVTVCIATSGMTLALAGAIPLALLATARLSVSNIGRDRMNRLPMAMRQVLRGLLVVLRSVPELILALLFVRIVGLGPTAGVLAIAISYCAMLAKVFSEIIESNDASASGALLANGSGRLAAFLYGALPQCASELTSYVVYRWECAVRASVIMGFVGAGGLGQQMDTSMKMMAGGEVATMLAVFMLLVWCADLVSAYARRRLG
jgi:phosphonate transport system permease protein